MPRFIDVAPGVGEDEVVSVVGPVCVQRQTRVTIDRDLALILALEEYCVACGFKARTNNNTTGTGAMNSPQQGQQQQEQQQQSPEYSAFLKKLSKFSKDELAATLLADLSALADMSAKCVGCIGCRTAIDKLLNRSPCPDSANGVLEPLLLTQEKFIAVNRMHMGVSIYTLSLIHI